MVVLSLNPTKETHHGTPTLEREIFAVMNLVDKPLKISSVSKDRQAGYGLASWSNAKGDKLHSIVGTDGSVAA